MEAKAGLSSQEERSLKGSEKLKMLDITRDKPVKVAVKVAVPVRDHPKFNFVGKLLGPKGNSMKRLQEDTMCKMAVLGRGSMRDRRKEEELRASGDNRYAHLFEDLHVEISTFAAPAEAHARIAYALAEVRRFLVPDYHDDIRQEQMWEMQALTSTPGLATQLDDSQSPTTSNSTGTGTGTGTNPNPSVSTCRGLAGGLADMDTSNDDKSDNDISGMDCLSPDKLDCSPACGSISITTTTEHAHSHAHAHAHPQHQQQQQQQQHHHHHHHHGHPHSHAHAHTHAHAQPSHFHQLLQQAHGGASAAAAAACGEHLSGQATPAAAAALHTTAMAVALQHQLTAAGIGGLLKPAAGVGATMAGLPTTQASAAALQLPSCADGEAAASTLTLLEPPGSALLHPALRNVKTINIGGGLGRKRPLLGVPRTGMNPTKRTVMSLLARAKNSQALHSVRQPVVTASSYAEPLQMLASPFIIPHHQAVDQHQHQPLLALSKESLAQGV
ncbi:homeobox protein abdominal-A [Drosophila subobscura]|uniref:homeobox protein abdominal-A n=1 Tax=Drosophila subobscura TaxID=7241 RepID=UPI00155AAC46|nr:homeobox protein abdominal-A [Drosophila subobscura]